jgi:hypothetical protein
VFPAQSRLARELVIRFASEANQKPIAGNIISITTGYKPPIAVGKDDEPSVTS